MKRKRILVPVDGSDGAAQAVALAADLALATDCTLDILHVSYFDSKTDSQADSWLPDEVAASSRKCWTRHERACLKDCQLISTCAQGIP